MAFMENSCQDWLYSRGFEHKIFWYRMNILLVDDDQVDRAIVKRTINRSDLDVKITESKTVDEGLYKYAQGNFDVILLDYRMPQRDGIEMIVELRNEPKDSSTAVVMMSSSEDEELALKCIRAGAQDFLVKTEITATRLRRAIQHATTRFELEMQLFKTYQQVKVLAETDSLTGLPNRYFFDETLKQAIANNRRSDNKLALLLIDIDNFKLVNDNAGHDTGDVLLKKIVSRIKGCLRGNELFARLGGDEFAITLTSLESNLHANMVAARIITIMKKPLEIAGTSINSTVSIGVAMHPDNGISSEELFKFADIAMYRAKKRGRNQVCFFEDKMQEKFLYRIEMESELRVALKDNSQFELFYQPIINPFDGTTYGFEALIRWRVNGKIRVPNQFVGIAEETKLIVPLGLWVTESAIATISRWNAGREKMLSIAINVSAIQLADNHFVEHLESCLSRYDVSAELIDIELTETALLRNTKKIIETISRINALGCNLSLDDFGTGFSSLSHLRNYPFSVVKIDKSLMPKDSNDKRNFELVEGVVAMAKILHMDIVAEGVETDLHVDLCKKLNIERIQGYYYSRPVSSLEVEAKFL
jgi:diguanylate cyclase (GGDEF)-like protein